MLRVILGITGGIAAYKATGIIRLLTEAGHSVQVIPTQNALRFIGATTLEALSHNAIDSDLYTDVESVKHVTLGQNADLVIVAPATAAFLGRFAAGIADDLLLNTLLVTNAKVVVAPAMHTEMWQHASTQNNVAVLRSRGVLVLEPASGRLTGSDTGPGRLPDPEQIVAQALSGFDAKSDWSGKRILVTAGGTQETIDPVRFIGNRSSGKQGIAFAQAAMARGATVTLIGANIDAGSIGAQFVPVRTFSQLEAELAQRLAESDLLVMAAAVSDFRVKNPSTSKMKRATNQSLHLELVANSDLLAGATARIKQERLRCRTLGFAAETAANDTELVDLALMKMRSKGCDYVFANDVGRHAIFGSDSNSALLVGSAGVIASMSGTKLSIAGAFLDAISSN